MGEDLERQVLVRQLTDFLDPEHDPEMRQRPVVILQSTFPRLNALLFTPWPGFSFPRIALQIHDRISTMMEQKRYRLTVDLNDLPVAVPRNT